MRSLGERPTMVDSKSQIKDFSLSLPITQAARKIAWQFAQQQPTLQKIEQVNLNTLAVSVVNDYLQMMGISTDLTAGDSWNPLMRLCLNVADLQVTGVGCLECRFMKVNEQSCHVPPEVWEDRVGYVVVQLNDSLQEATVIGFVPTVAMEYLPVSQLQPLENLLVHLNQLAQPVAAVTNRALVNLSQWLENVFAAGWQELEAVLGSQQASLAFSFRRADSSLDDANNTESSSVRRAKSIDLGIQLAGNSVALLVEIRPDSNQKTDIVLQVHPTGRQTYLPSLLELVVLDQSGAIFLEAQARHADNYIQLQFSGKLGERFNVKVALGEVSITESFVI